MIPIDGVKLTKPSEEDIRGGWTLNTDIMSEIEKIGDDVWEEFNPCLEGVEVVLISLLKCKSLQFKPGSLIIQREEGYELRECNTCISYDMELISSCRTLDSEWSSDRHAFDLHEKRPCKYHITESELRAAYIVGGEEK